MTTLPSPGTKTFPEDSLEKKCYNFVETLAKYIPIPNERYRLAFNLYRFKKGEGDPPAVILRSAKIKFENISQQELAALIDEGIKNF
ncbi:hypothetical protein [Melioribacter sp. OK-6-Me]|uniref:hypothetical protein n=1 Tax=unclassified Melioribacter TaxID=2627329 RepID=UPI003EDB6507